MGNFTLRRAQGVPSTVEGQKMKELGGECYRIMMRNTIQPRSLLKNIHAGQWHGRHSLR